MATVVLKLVAGQGSVMDGQDVFLMISVIYHELYAEDKQLKYSLITHIYCEFSLNSIYFQISIYTWQHTWKMD